MHDSQTTLILTAMLFLALPAMVLLVLSKLASPTAAYIWCLGSFLAGTGLVLMSLRPWLPQWLTYNVANTCLLGSFLGWTQSLRTTLGSPWSRQKWWMLLVSCALFYSLLLAWTTPVHRGVGTRVLLSVLSFYTSYCALRLFRHTGGGNAMTIAIVYLMLALALAAHAFWPGGAISSPNPFSKSWDASLLALMALMTAMVSHFAYVGLMLDIATRERLQAQAVQQATRETRTLDIQLKDMDRRRQTLLVSGSLAHEISQPLTMATMNIELAKWHCETEPEKSQDIAGLLTKVQIGVDHTARILQRASGELDETVLTLQTLDLRDVLAQSLSLVESELSRFNVDLVCSKSPQKVTCQGDPVALSQVLVNLIRNAAQVMAGLEIRQLSLSCHEQLGQAVVEIADTGPGFSQEMLEHWGEPFMSTRVDGLGLGLAISLDIVRQHGGTLMLSNQSCGGLLATVSIPSAPGLKV